MYTLTATLALLATANAYTMDLGSGTSQTAYIVGDMTIDGTPQSTSTAGGDIISGPINGSPCPNNSGSVQIGGIDGSFCCPGSVGGQDENSYCCVGNFQQYPDCFPFCSGSETSSSSRSCQATVMFTDSDYSSKIAAATGSASGGMMTNMATTTMASGSSGSSGSGGSAAAQTGSSSSSQAGAAMITSGPMAGALMVAGGLLMGL